MGKTIEEAEKILRPTYEAEEKKKIDRQFLHKEREIHPAPIVSATPESAAETVVRVRALARESRHSTRPDTRWLHGWRKESAA